MAISSEVAQAVRDNNLLRVRIMLKDSLLIDKSFNLFDEMQAYASAQGISPWAYADIPLEKAEKPWTEDTMNYELTALVNDFTKEHVNYVKAIVSDIYKTSVVSRQQSYATPVERKPEMQKPQPTGSRNSIFGSSRNTEDPYKTILTETSSINRILKNNKDDYSGKRRWLDDDITYIKRHAQKILDACNEIQRRG